MAEDNKELMKMDLVVIKKLHKKTDYSQRNNLKSIYDYVLSKELFKTNLGKKYLARLLSLYEASNISNTCIICGKICEDNPIVCNQCNQKLLASDQVQKPEVKHNDTVTIDPPIVTKEVIKEAVPTKQAENKSPTAKKRGKKFGAVVLILLFICFIISRFTSPNDNKQSSTVKNNVAGENNQKNTVIDSENTPTKSILKSTSKNNKTETSKQTQQKIDTSKSTKDHNGSKSKSKTKKENETKNDYFNFTENDLMSKIQKTLVKSNLDIGTKEGYPHIFFVLDHGIVSNVAYQVALNSDEKVVSVSVNISAPVDDLTLFSKAVTTAILSCDSKIKKAEVKSLIDNIHSKKVMKINGISYFAGALTDNILTYGITSASIPDHLQSSKQESINLSPLLGMTPDKIHSKLGNPISSAENTEYYSDILSIVYENGVAYKIILGLEERFDFTQIVIPGSYYTIQNIHLNDTEASIHNIAKDSSIFIYDGVFYGNTYQIEQAGYYVNVDFFTLQNIENCPVYRLVLTRLNQVK